MPARCGSTWPPTARRPSWPPCTRRQAPGGCPARRSSSLPEDRGRGASSFGESNPLQRVWRDTEAGSRHAVLNPEVAAEIYGKSLFGIRGSVSALV
ncbi:hypothetical protein [Streptomyces boncukensis]|uniref:hypothetical protein n=1 Tax=Streptomyces boncukensis TaxID=2711219 RepID=UPI001F49D0E1|nr:hypothetical protein [Streptomyces boncukensis]